MGTFSHIIFLLGVMAYIATLSLANQFETPLSQLVVSSPAVSPPPRHLPVSRKSTPPVPGGDVRFEPVAPTPHGELFPIPKFRIPKWWPKIPIPKWRPKISKPKWRPKNSKPKWRRPLKKPPPLPHRAPHHFNLPKPKSPWHWGRRSPPKAAYHHHGSAPPTYHHGGASDPKLPRPWGRKSPPSRPSTPHHHRSEPPPHHATPRRTWPPPKPPTPHHHGSVPPPHRAAPPTYYSWTPEPILPIS